jgi:hypothetical protein
MNASSITCEKIFLPRPKLLCLIIDHESWLLGKSIFYLIDHDQVKVRFSFQDATQGPTKLLLIQNYKVLIDIVLADIL